MMVPRQLPRLILALSHRPRLLILDEPAVALDAVSKSEVFSELGARRGLRELSATPVTLEELFISLARG